jgi:hypothetical protein
MKKLIIALVLIPVIGISSCDPAKRIAKKKAKNELLKMDGIYRLNVSFISIGSGTDSEAKKQFEQFVADYETKNKVKLVSEMAKWGREGEVDFCFKLDELKAKQQENFIKELKEHLKDSQLVRFTENVPCKKR